MEEMNPLKSNNLLQWEKHKSFSHFFYMRWEIIILLLLMSCSSPKLQRSIASVEEEFGEVSLVHSKARIYPSSENGTLKYYIFLQLRDADGQAVNAYPSQIILQTALGNKIKYSYQKSGLGGYYLSLPNFHQSEIRVIIGSALLTKLKIHEKSKLLSSEIRLIRRSAYRATFQFRILDEFKNKVEISESPDIVIDNQSGLVEEVRQVNKSTWKFDLVYPDENQLIYISVRSNGRLFPNIFRFQYLEIKD